MSDDDNSLLKGSQCMYQKCDLQLQKFFGAFPALLCCRRRVGNILINVFVFFSFCCAAFSCHSGIPMFDLNHLFPLDDESLIHSWLRMMILVHFSLFSEVSCICWQTTAAVHRPSGSCILCCLARCLPVVFLPYWHHLVKTSQSLQEHIFSFKLGNSLFFINTNQYLTISTELFTEHLINLSDGNIAVPGKQCFLESEFGYWVTPQMAIKAIEELEQDICYFALSCIWFMKEFFNNCSAQVHFTFHCLVLLQENKIVYDMKNLPQTLEACLKENK